MLKWSKGSRHLKSRLLYVLLCGYPQNLIKINCRSSNLSFNKYHLCICLKTSFIIWIDVSQTLCLMLASEISDGTKNKIKSCRCKNYIRQGYILLHTKEADIGNLNSVTGIIQRNVCFLTTCYYIIGSNPTQMCSCDGCSMQNSGFFVMF